MKHLQHLGNVFVGYTLSNPSFLMMVHKLLFFQWKIVCKINFDYRMQRIIMARRRNNLITIYYYKFADNEGISCLQCIYIVYRSYFEMNNNISWLNVRSYATFGPIYTVQRVLCIVDSDCFCSMLSDALKFDNQFLVTFFMHVPQQHQFKRQNGFQHVIIRLCFRKHVYRLCRMTCELILTIAFDRKLRLILDFDNTQSTFQYSIINGSNGLFHFIWNDEIHLFIDDNFDTVRLI